ncbi:hypothetical protein ACQUQP_13680 [Marinobacterium sp. YM272]|uniref:hypothetical protein n=1 Tax=Marinobacterium sp. YM272 TaxID=3421654 RepID=UPI003D7F7203
MLPGDILLLTGEGKLSSSLVAMQKVIYSKARSSHVEFCLGDGIFIHSTGDKGVHLTLLLDEDVACEGRWRVIRHKTITEAGLNTEKLQKAAMFFYAQGYNKVFMGSGNEKSSFCSELVAKAYERAGIKIISGKAPSKVTPAHFDLEADNLEDWLDVTEEYKAILADMKENEFPYRFAATTLSAAMNRRKIHEPLREKIIERFENGSLKNQELAREMREMLSGRELNFWHEKDS